MASMGVWNACRESAPGGRLAREIRVFLSYPRNMRVLLVTNLIYSFAMPVFYMFTNTYILRNSESVSMVIVYQLATYTGIPFTFYVNGWLLKHFQIRWLDDHHDGAA
jgi:YQGE family putative transporter